MATTKATTLAHTLGGISSDISTAEINRLDGVTGDIQTLLNLKAPIASPTFTGTANISSGATFPDGIVEEVYTLSYEFASNNTHDNTTESYKIATRSTSSNAGTQSVSVVSGYTYVYDFAVYLETEATVGGPTPRGTNLRLYDHSSQQNQNDSPSGDILATAVVGRRLSSGSGNDARSFNYINLRGVQYYGSTETRYIAVATQGQSTSNQTRLYMHNIFHSKLTVWKIKGNKRTVVT